MNRNKQLLGFQIICVGIGFILLNIVLLEKSYEFLNPFFSFFNYVSTIIKNLFNISASMKYLPFFLMYFPIIILGVYYIIKENDVKEGVTNTNLYFEYRQWNFFWGWFFDGKKEVQNILNYYNSKGWKIVDFEWAQYFSHFGLFKTIAILYTTIMTIGVLTYWGGFFAIFEGVSHIKDNKELDEKEIYQKYNFLEWSKKNPNKSIHDYYLDQKSE
jgi:hypothetical protein